MSEPISTQTTVSFNSRETVVTTPSGQLPIRILSPATDELADRPLLLISIALDVDTSLGEEPYNIAAMSFLANGHRVVGFDLPSHGARVDECGQGIVGFRNSFVQGRDPFELFLEETRAVIDHCIESGLAERGLIAIHGTSRAGYLAMRLLASDERIGAGAAMAPVTDWRYLRDFAEDAEREDVLALQISRYADLLVGRPLYVIIGNNDERVSTASCCRFFADLVDAHHRLGKDSSTAHFLVSDVPGHSSQPSWYSDSARFLMEQLGA